MRKIVRSLAVALLSGSGLHAQQTAAPQTARQALMEMFFSKTPGTLIKHLPAATRAALEKSGAMASLQQYSQMMSQFQSQGQNFQTFETGSILLSGEDPKTGQKVEITVENDTLRGDEDDIEVSFLTYKNGQPQRTPFMPQITFSFKRETQVWALNEISVTIHLPLADPALLKLIAEGVKPQVNASPTIVPTTPAENPAQSAANDALVVAAMRTIVTAESTYASSYPNVGYTCTLSSLDGFGGGEPNEHQAMLISSGLASGKKYGYVFTLSGCMGPPANSFRLIAIPSGNSYGRKAFCADHAGIVRWSNNGDITACMTSGTPAQ